MVILIEPELHLAGDVVVPDLAGWHRGRMPEVPSVAGFELAPDTPPKRKPRNFRFRGLIFVRRGGLEPPQELPH